MPTYTKETALFNTGAINQAIGAVETIAKSKRRVFTSEPIPPYDVGDLRVSADNTSESDETEEGATSAIYMCISARSSGEFDDSDWVLASTDDSQTAVLREYIDAYIESSEAESDRINEDLEAIREELNETRTDFTDKIDEILSLRSSAEFVDSNQDEILEAISAAKRNSERLEELGSFLTLVNQMLRLSALGSPLETVISNDRISFRYDGEEVAFINALGFNFAMGIVRQELRIGNFLLKGSGTDGTSGRFDVMYSPL